MSAARTLRMHEAAANDARPLHDLFTAWVQRGPGERVQRIDCHVRTFGEAFDAALMSCQHKDVLHLLHTDRISGNKMLHCYVIRAGKRIWRHGEGYVTHLKPDLIFSMPVIDFAPVEPWRWSPGADVVGASDGVIER